MHCLILKCEAIQCIAVLTPFQPCNGLPLPCPPLCGMNPWAEFSGPRAKLHADEVRLESHDSYQ